MNRFTLEQKLEIVKHYLNSNDGYKNTGKKFKIAASQVRFFVSKYKQNGIEGLKVINHYFPPEFKLKVLEYQKLHHLSDFETAVFFKIPDHSTVGVWRRKFSNGESLYPPQKKQVSTLKKKKIVIEDQNLQKLQEEVEYLRMENAILKKEQALIQEKEKEILLKKQKLLKN